MASIEPGQQRRFAVEVVGKLREAGFEAYWAGGCVRDVLLGRMPKDYDVATSATPEEVQKLFGARRTLALGAAFGVISVLGPRGAGQIEVATFRREADYSDGRHPDHVTFSTAREDAARRDFTINGMFYDAIDREVLDFVGGQEDLKRGVIRAIGNPQERISEDKLRMLRAVRFAATFDFTLDEATFAAIRQRAGEIGAVSAERIAAEMQRMLVDRRRGAAVRLMLETGLAEQILPEIVPADRDGQERLERVLAVLDRLEEPTFALALAALLDGAVDAEGVGRIGARWRLSNKDADRVGWLIEHRGVLAHARNMPWSALQPILIHEGMNELLAWEEAALEVGSRESEHVAYCRQKLAEPREFLDPMPLVTGEDLIAHGIPTGPVYRELLRQIRDAQLDGKIASKREALELADRFMRKDQTP